jgi:ABC-type polysaccharide/polyol phosphate export permease
MLNPLAPILEGLRLSVVDGHNLLTPIIRATDGALIWTPLYLGYSLIWAFGGLAISALIFHRSQYRFAEYV